MEQCLTEAGFEVDITDWRSVHAPFAGKYDLVIGQARAFLASCRRCRKRIPRIYLGWGLYAARTKEAVAERVRQFELRHGIRSRESHPQDQGPLLATDIFYVGNDYVRDTYRAITCAPTFELPNPIVEGVPVTLDEKRFTECGRHFMWMAAYGPLRRGLDVLLDVFAVLPDHHLWVCGGLEYEKEFHAFYRGHLSARPNIHYMGWVDVGGETFADVTRRCAYMLYPSVSDGMPGSVVNTMAAGVIPMVTASAGIDTGGFGITIPRIDHDTIRSLVTGAAQVAPESLAAEANRVSLFAKKRYSQTAFREAFRESLFQVLERYESTTARSGIP
jgi:glycosyltransferase involved in cell wall biosynthesis